MSDLEDVFGEDFAKHVSQRTAERRQERNRLTEKQMAKVAHLAVNEGKFEDGDPQFTFTTENGITHSVMLVQVPDPDNSEVWDHLSEPWDGAARLPLEYLGQWYWSTFPEKKDVAKLEQGDHAIVAGSIDESEGENGEIYYNIYPVRGVLTLEEAQDYASRSLSDFEDDEDEGTSDDDFISTDDDDVEEEEDDDSASDDDGLAFDSDDSGGSGGLDDLMDDGDDEDEEEEPEPAVQSASVPYEDIAAMVEKLSENQDPDEEPQVFEIQEGSEHHQRLTTVVCNNLQLSEEEAVAEVIMDVIEGHREDEEDEDDETELLF